ncbi:alkyl/aryl-sulfatase [Bdellovibrio sp. KM01]|uniref:alkyl/aryl-sulfatase n=1 Tax=Bdellovibrio sp. KM01 TaxID=2748865 RepID=UPI0015E95847|nr:alkyl sulfatase dimerization domain-containing protein [Bdellovibrio sp. KM01]QLY26728.1 MBL fold metallo-hydrolase [Bdellovibrio sp. KM01]
MKNFLSSTALSATVFAFTASVASAADLPEGKATETTRRINQSYSKMLDFSNKEDFEFAQKGFIATLDNPMIKDAEGKTVYNLNAFNFVKDTEAPDTANPSLWRQSQLTRIHGLFKVTDKIYQIRGFDISNMTLIEGKSGWIVIDPLISSETAAAGLKLANEKLGKRPVKAVIYTHSHIDHFGGVLGVTSEADIKAKKTQIIAPDGFMEEATSENLYAGNAMGRRAIYMYGRVMTNSPIGNLGTGLGPGTSLGTSNLIPPTKIITKTGEKMNVDGIDIVFQMAPGTEAPSEMLFYFPQMKALCLSEDATSTMHNLYTLRGAKVRSPLVWSTALNTTLDMFGDKTDVSFASHHWPRWGNAKVTEHLTKQRDMYKFINDQTLRLANQGYDAEEIAEKMKLPDTLAKEFYNRGYYGTLSHNVKATFQLYLGFYNGNPATLHRHPRVESSKRYVTAMGGASKVLKMGRESFDKGDYRWTAELVNHLVYAEPGNKEAKKLQAAALEQLGFQAESGPWRDVYLSGAAELRTGDSIATPPLLDPRSLPLAMLIDYTGLRLNPEKTQGKSMKLGLTVSGTKDKQVLELNNSVLHLRKMNSGEKVDASYSMSSADLGSLLGGLTTTEELKRSGRVKYDGQAKAMGDLVAMLDTFDPGFNLVTPVEEKTTKDDRMANVNE